MGSERPQRVSILGREILAVPRPADAQEKFGRAVLPQMNGMKTMQRPENLVVDRSSEEGLVGDEVGPPGDAGRQLSEGGQRERDSFRHKQLLDVAVVEAGVGGGRCA